MTLLCAAVPCDPARKLSLSDEELGRSMVNGLRPRAAVKAPVRRVDRPPRARLSVLTAANAAVLNDGFLARRCEGLRPSGVRDYLRMTTLTTR